MKNLYKIILICFGTILYIDQTITLANAATCNWKSRNAYTTFWDSCSSRPSVNAYIVFKSGSSCFTYQWTVNGKSAGNSNVMNYPISSNGTYTICVKVIDSCNNCDTTYCGSRTVTCIKSTCNWKGRSAATGYWDSCNTSTGKYSVNGYISFSSKSCLKYQWTVNGAKAGTHYIMNYPITANGKYSICVKVTDTCSNCDTTYCTSRSITCVKGSACNWKSRSGATAFWDSCNSSKNRYSLNGYISFSSRSCLQYKWTVNGAAAGTNYYFNFPINANGTYSICVKVIDSCNNCDTSYCASRTITCINTGNKCNWKSRKPSLGFFDSCNTIKNIYALMAYINYSSKSCYSYQWTLNGIKAGNGYSMNYHITSNGTYNVCVKVIDSCNRCDTTYCSTRTITCVKGGTCNWKSRNPYTSFWDSCNSTKNRYGLNAYVYFSSKACYKYQWTVNGQKAGNSYIMNYPITTNGTYSVCVKVSDTCNNCDTTYCSTRYFTCVKGGTCNWKSRTPANGYWDSCTGKANKYSLNAYIFFTNYYYKSCLKYQWSVNGVSAGKANIMSYPVSANGTYTICVKVIDTCNNCDTTYCTTRNFNCVGKNYCNWKARSGHTYFHDSCNTTQNKYSLIGLISFSKNYCLKYQWMINGAKVGTTNYLNYPITTNGKYSVCVLVTDTCNNCDTSYCYSTTITCIKSNKCNWNQKGPYLVYWDSCSGKKNKYSLNAYSTFTSGRTCHTYQWTVNGKNAGNNYYMSYPVSGNGTYAVCLKVSDSCHSCDTTFCTYRVFNCQSTKCNWKSKNAYFITKDTCINGTKNYSLNGVIALAGSSNCYIYQWSVNSHSAGSNQYMTYNISKNGSYDICVKVKDTCHNCDTTYCRTVYVSCVPAGINKFNTEKSFLKVYPNPSEGIVKLDWTEGTSGYNLLNTTGQVLQSGNLENGTNILDLSKYSSGLYLIEIRNRSTNFSGKISIQRK